MNQSMGELEARFRAEARDTAGQIAELIDSLPASEDREQRCETIRELAHRLRGAAGVFGFSELKLRAGELEAAAQAQAAMPKSASGGPKLAAALDLLVAALPAE